MTSKGTTQDKEKKGRSHSPGPHCYLVKDKALLAEKPHGLRGLNNGHTSGRSSDHNIQEDAQHDTDTHAPDDGHEGTSRHGCNQPRQEGHQANRRTNRTAQLILQPVIQLLKRVTAASTGRLGKAHEENGHSQQSKEPVKSGQYLLLVEAAEEGDSVVICVHLKHSR